MKQNKSKQPYKPVPFRKGNTNLRVYKEPYEDKVGNKAIITKVDYTDKKGNLMIGYQLYVKWLD